MWTANAALEDRQLWDDIAAGKKFLTWRIGHETFVVGQISRDNTGLIAYLNNGETRPIKNHAHLQTHWNHHPDYRAMAEIVLNLAQAASTAPVELDEKPDGVYRYSVSVGQFATRSAECDGGLLEKDPPEQIAERVIAALEKDWS